jgi:aspartate beta-hydroxylase
VAGLSATAWHDAAAYPWLRVLEENASAIQAELSAALEPDAAVSLARRGESIWAPPVRDDATAYGPEWRTLVLQDRG